MSKKYKIRNNNNNNNNNFPYFITLTIIDWVDLLTRPQYKHTIVDALNYCSNNKGLIIHSYVIMTNHIHLIISSKEGFSLPGIIRDLKRHTSKELYNQINSSFESRKEWLIPKFNYAGQRTSRNTNFKIWQDGYHPIELNTFDLVDQKVNYIHQNPVRSGIVLEEHFYKFSSARDYSENKGDVYLTLFH